MASTGKRLLMISLVFAAGGIAGLAAGGYWGFQRGNASILNEALAKDAWAVRSHLVTLRHLRAGDGGQATESLEAHLDDELIVFDPALPYSGLTSETNSEIDTAIEESREYRLTYARQSSRPAVDEMVRNVLSRNRAR